MAGRSDHTRYIDQNPSVDYNEATPFSMREDPMTGDFELFEEVFGILSRAAPADESLQDILRKVLTLVDSHRGAIFLLDEKRKVMVRRARIGIPAEVIDEYSEVPLGEHIIGKVGLTGEKVLVDDVSNDARVRLPFLEEVGIGSFACVPVLSRGTVLGVLTVAGSVKQAISPQQLSLLASVGHQVGVAIDNARLLTRSLRSERLYRHLVEHAPDLNLLCDPELRILKMNRGGLRFFNLDREEFDRPGLGELLPPESLAPFLVARDALTGATAEGTEFEITCEGSDGKWECYEFRSSLVREEEDRFYLNFVGRNLTRRKELEKRLLEYADQLEGEVEKRIGELRSAKNQIAYLFQVSRQIGDLELVDEKLNLIVNAVSEAGLFRKVMIRVHNREGVGGRIASCGYDTEEMDQVIEEVFAENAFKSDFLKSHYSAVPTGNSYLISSSEQNNAAGTDWVPGDRFVVALTGSAGSPVGFLLAEEPLVGKRPEEDLVQVLELFISLAVQAIEAEKLSERLREADRLRREQVKPFNLENLIGTTREMKEVFNSIQKLAHVRSSVLITGESGTGKELVANAIHVNGNRADGPFIKINCAAIPETLLESELFGIEKNVATNVDRRIGKFELAHGGTILLDEIADMSMVTQAKVLRVLQERMVERVGGDEAIPVDVRILAATNRDPFLEVEMKNLRQDLFFRLHVVRIHLPALRERRADIPLLADHLIDRICREQELKSRRLSPEVLDLFLRFPWEGNIRQLRNCLERTLIMGGEEGEIALDDLPQGIRLWESTGAEEETPEGEADLAASMEAYERQMIVEALEKASWVQSRAAKLLGISERAIWYRVKKLKISFPG